MGLDLWAFDTLQTVWLPPDYWGYLLVLLYVLLLARVAVANRSEWRAMVTPQRMAALFFLLAMGFMASGLFLVYFPEPDILPVPNLPEMPPTPGAPLFGAMLIMLVGGWLGAGPAALLGFLSGLARAVWLTGRGIQTLELALVAAIVAFLLRQNYHGRLFAWLRHPVAAGMVGGLASSLLTFPSLIVSTSFEASILPIVDYAWSLTSATVLPNLLEWTVAGVLAWLAFSRLPAFRPKIGQLVSPPYEHSLTSRFLYLLTPLFLLVIVGLLVAVTNIAIDSATDLTLKQMSHDARVASEAIPDITLISSNLLTRFAEEDFSSPEERENVMGYTLDLETDLRTTAYFRQLVLFDHLGELWTAFPRVDDEDAVPLVSEEINAGQLAATLGYPSTTHVWVAEEGVPMLSHVVPIRGEDGRLMGALMGRVDLAVALNPTVNSLQGTVGAGRGFIVDEQWSIIAHPNAERVMQPWIPMDGAGGSTLDDRLASDDTGHAYEGVAASGARQLVYYLEGPGHPWAVVVIVPYETVLSLATEVAAPLAGFLVVASGLVAMGLVVLTRRLTQPLGALARASTTIARGDFETPVRVGGEDEVGRLGRSFEQMRQALRDRVGELQLLLEVSRSVAGSLNLAQALPTVLDGALQATGADGVRIVFADKDRGPLTFANGSLGGVMAPLDVPIARMVQHEPNLRIENTARMRAVLDIDRLTDRVGAILALPLRTSQRFFGVLWIAYREPHTFSNSEVNFVSTLAGQASVLIENVQLFETTEGDRRRLAAILASTSDAVIVTDPHDYILLLNPAAEAAFGISATEAMEQPAADVLTDPGLVNLLLGKDNTFTREVELPDGRTLYASASSITGDDHQMMGRVAVLRDITHLKELDEMKTEFVNTVSHDLRSPLTYMRGYVTMLPMVGELSPKQSEYVEKILTGVDQMTELVVDLLNLARIEADVDQMTEPVQINNLVEQAVKGYRARAMGKGLAFDVQVAQKLPVIMGEPALLRQAVSNLVDNAIKYTPSGGVRIRTYVDKGDVIVEVKDTGPGISQADQVRLFEKFYRVKRRDNLDIKGSGLGLAIVKSIVERRHNGRVWVESQLGTGSSFFVALPINSGRGDRKTTP